MDTLDTLGGIYITFADLDTVDFFSRATGGGFAENLEGIDTFLSSSYNNNAFGVKRISFGRISLAPSAPGSTLAGYFDD